MISVMRTPATTMCAAAFRIDTADCTIESRCLETAASIRLSSARLLRGATSTDELELTEGMRFPFALASAAKSTRFGRWKISGPAAQIAARPGPSRLEQRRTSSATLPSRVAYMGGVEFESQA